MRQIHIKNHIITNFNGLLLKLILFCCLLTNSIYSIGQNQSFASLTVGDGSYTTGYTPLNVSNLYSYDTLRSQTLYTSDKLEHIVGQTIDSIRFYISSFNTTNGWNNVNWKVRIGLSTLSEMNDFDNDCQFVEVHNGPLVIDAGNTLTIRFSQPFVYTGGSLIVEFSRTENAGTGVCLFYAERYWGHSFFYIIDTPFSSTSGPFLPKTTFYCQIEDVPYFEPIYCEDFEECDVNSLPDGWNRYYVNGGTVGVNTEDARNDGKSLHFFRSPQNTEIYVTMPDLHYDSLQEIDMYFYYRRVHDFTRMSVGVMEQLGSVSSFVPIDTIYAQTDRRYELQHVSFASYNGSGRHIAFRYYCNRTYPIDAQIDDIVLIKSRKPHIELIESNRVRVTADEQYPVDYWLEYGLEGTTPGGMESTLMHVTQSPIYITLQDSSKYWFSYYPNVADTAGRDRTCLEADTIVTRVRLPLPYCEDFERYEAYDRAPYWSHCVSDDFLATLTPKVRIPFFESGNKALNLQGSTGGKVFAIFPEFECDSMQQLSVDFDAAYHQNIGMFYLIVGVMSDAADTASFVAFDTLPQIGSWQHYHYDISDYYHGDGRFLTICYYMPESTLYTGAHFYIDNIEIHAAEPIFQLGEGGVVNVNYDMSNLPIWVEYGYSGFTPGSSSGTRVQIVQSPQTIATLEPNQDYDFYYSTSQTMVGCQPTILQYISCNTYFDTTVTTCNSYTWHGITSTTSTLLTDTLTNVAGCDSIVTLHLTIINDEHGNVETTVHDSILTTDLPYTWNGITFYGQVSDLVSHYTMASGCDSMVHYNLHVFMDSLMQEGCQSDTVAEGSTTNNKLPIYGSQGNNVQRSQTIYPASMLTDLIGKRIDSLHYYVNSGSFNGGDWTVSIGVTRWSLLIFTYDDVSNLTEVYHGPLTANASEGMGIKLDTPFPYVGGNLLIQFVQESCSSSSNCYFKGTSISGGPSRIGYTSYGNVSAISGSSSNNFIPQLSFYACPDSTIDTSHVSNGIALPYCENFDNYPYGEGNMPLYWGGYNTLNIDLGRYPLITHEYSVSPANSFALHIMSNNSCYAILPDFAIDSLKHLNLSFKCRNKPSDQGMLIIGVLPDTNDITSFQPLDTLYPSGSQWEQVNYSFSHYQGTAKRVAFLDRRLPGYTFANIYIDDFIATVWNSPTIELYASNIARVIVPEGNVADYWLEYGTHGFTPGEDPSTLVHVTTSSYYITDLLPNTEYDFYTYPALDSNTVVRGTCHNPTSVTAMQSCIIMDTVSVQVPITEMPYVINGETLDSAGTYIQNFTTPLGCDSILTIILDVRLHSYDDTVVAISGISVQITPTLNDSINCDNPVISIITPSVHGSSTIGMGNNEGCEDDIEELLNPLDLPQTEDESVADFQKSGGDANDGSADAMIPTITYYQEPDIYDPTFVGWDSLQIVVACGSGDSDTSWIYINIIPPIDTVATVCDSLVWYGDTLRASGNYYHLFSSDAGLDSAYMLHLTVNHSSMGDTTATACDTFDWYGNIYTESATPTHILTNSVGCDSVITLTLTVNNSDTSDTTVVACNSFSWYGVDYTASATPTYTFTNSAGCDSVVTLNLTVNYSTVVHIYDTVYENDLPYTFNSIVLNSDTVDAIIRMKNIHGCDSTILYSLNVLWNSASAVDSTVCYDMLPVTWNGRLFDTAATQMDTLVNAVGADSIVTMTLNIDYGYRDTVVATICDNETYTFEGVGFTTDTLYSLFLQTVSQCDSIRTLSLTVNNSSTGDTAAVACNTFSWYGTDYTASATPTHMLTNAAGCDSVVTLALTVYYSSTGDTTAVVCDSFNWYGVDYVTSATPSNTLTNVAGCDSVVTLNLTVNHSNTGDTAAVVCDSFSWYGTEYTASAIATHTLTNVDGCDSVVTLSLTVNYSTTGDTSAVVCDSFTWYGTDYTASATPAHSFTNAVGCDSLVTLNLTVNYSTMGDTSAVVCDTFSWYGTDYTASATPTHTFVNAVDCDSLVTLDLTVNNSTVAYIHETVHENDLPHTYNGLVLNSDTIGAVVHLTNAAGCDSTVTYSLTVLWNSSTNVDSTVCDDMLPLTWNSRVFTSQGIQRDTLTTGNGTDSVVVMTLYVNPTYSDTVDAAICDDESYTFFGDSYSDDTVHSVVLYSAAGCDSVVTLHLTVNATTAGDTSAVVCDTFSWYGNDYTVTSTPTHTLTNAAGCDSIVTLDLTVNNSTVANIHDTVHENNLPHIFNGFVLNSDTIGAVVHLTNAAGCDSTVTYSLTVLWNSSTNVDSTVCDDMLPLTWNGHLFSSQGTQQDTLVNSIGADSIVYMTLHVNPTYSDTVVATICEDESYAFEGVDFVDDTLHSVLLQTTSGCDSLRTLSLSVHSSTYGDTSATACNSMEWHGMSLDVSGDTIWNTTNVVGCDSIVTLHLVINHCSTTDTLAADSLVWGDTVYYTNDTIIEGYDTVLVTICYTVRNSLDTMACNLFTFKGNVYNADTTILDTVAKPDGCDSITTILLTINHCSTTDTLAADSLVWGDTVYYTNDTIIEGYDTVNVFVCNTVRTSLDTAVCNAYLYNGVVYDSNATIFDTVTKADGCDSITTILLTVNYCSASDTLAADSLVWGDTVFYTNDTIIEGFDTIIVIICKTVRVEVDTMVCEQFSLHGIAFTADTTIVDTVAKSDGCDSIATINLTVFQPTHIVGTDTMCYNDVYSWHGMTYQSDNTTDVEVMQLNDTLVDIHGCDSFVTMLVTKLALPQFEFTTMAECKELTYTIDVEATAPMVPGGDAVPLPYLQWSSEPADAMLAGHEGDSSVRVSPSSQTRYTVTAFYNDMLLCPATDGVTLSPVVPTQAELKVVPGRLGYGNLEYSAYDIGHLEGVSRTWMIDWHNQGETGPSLHRNADIDSDSVVVALVIDNGHCKDTAVRVVPIDKVALFAPNIFTPDNDNNNRFEIITQGVISGELYIFDRDGLLVYETADYTQGWDGRDMSGNMCTQQSYVWKLIYRAVDRPERNRVEVGSVLLIH